MTEESTFPRLISTGELNNIQELYLTSEAIVVCRFNPPSTLCAVATLLGSFYSFNTEFPKGSGGLGKNVFLFSEHRLLGQTSATLPLSVENVLSDLQKVKN